MQELVTPPTVTWMLVLVLAGGRWVTGHLLRISRRPPPGSDEGQYRPFGQYCRCASRLGPAGGVVDPGRQGAAAASVRIAIAKEMRA